MIGPDFLSLEATEHFPVVPETMRPLTESEAGAFSTTNQQLMQVAANLLASAAGKPVAREQINVEDYDLDRAANEGMIPPAKFDQEGEK